MKPGREVQVWMQSLGNARDNNTYRILTYTGKRGAHILKQPSFKTPESSLGEW